MDDRPQTPRSDGFGQNKKNQDPLLYKKYFSKYRTIKKLGEGSFGKVYKAEYNGEYYAIKFEEKSKGQNLLETEATIMSYLKGPNIPFIKSFGYSGDYNILVMQLLGKSLEELFNKKLKFSIKTVSLLAYQMITVLQYIHDRHIIHRDIKPDNFVMGLNKDNATLFLLDFGLAKKYRSSKTLEQYPYIKKKKLTGTARYASIHALEEMEQSRRDDLESVGYVLMYFLRGNLPWQGLKIKSKEDRYKKILDKKKETTSEQLCKNFPDEFREYLEYCRNLEYTETPKYDKLKSKFYDLVSKRKENFDFVYDWTTENDLKKRKLNITNTVGNVIELKTTTTKDVEIKSKKIVKENEKIGEINNSINNNNNNINGSNNLNKILIKEDEKDIVKVEEDNIINNKVDSRCCMM
jgi:serine/threonine protein kinase